MPVCCVQALVAISPTDDSEARLCPLYPYRFVAGQCMTTQFLSFGYKVRSDWGRHAMRDAAKLKLKCRA